MVDQDIADMYDLVISYIKDKISYFEDPAYVSKEFQDFIDEFDLTEVVYNIQRHADARPTISESNLIKAYRDIRSAQAEYSIRLMGRKDYFRDSILEETDNASKWQFNKVIVNLHINGKDSGA